jgi:hypothetical protein
MPAPRAADREPAVLPPGAVRAAYREQVVPAYAGNPFIEALPPIRSRAETALLLARDLPYHHEQRALPIEVRGHLVAQIPEFFEPLAAHLELDDRLARMIRLGYRARNPLAPDFQPHLAAAVGVLGAAPPRPPPRITWTSATSMTLLGISGIGKSTALEASLDLYPQVIAHSAYQGRALPRLQLVWLKLDCPGDGSIRGLCLNFFQAVDALLGTAYERHLTQQRATVDLLLPRMARVAAQHGLGLLVIDEVQHLCAARSGGERRMLNFFVQLVNTIGLPVVLVGTYHAQPLLAGEFRQARRGEGQGDFLWERMALDATFRHFCTALWPYQYLRQVTPLTETLLGALYDESQGITDFVVKLFVLAQHRAMVTGIERLEPSLIHSVAIDSLRQARPVLQALKRGDLARLARLEDVLPIDLARHLPGAPGVPPAARAAAPLTAAPDAAVPGESVRHRPPKTADASGAPAGAARDTTLVALVRAGRARHRSAHATLAAHGLLRDLGTEVCRPVAPAAAEADTGA